VSATAGAGVLAGHAEGHGPEVRARTAGVLDGRAAGVRGSAGRDVRRGPRAELPAGSGRKVPPGFEGGLRGRFTGKSGDDGEAGLRNGLPG
jgi:hypothetical protein